jgi:hypothetical protein
MDDTYKWVFDSCEISDPKTQLRLYKLSKTLNISVWEMLINLEQLTDVSLNK